MINHPRKGLRRFMFRAPIWFYRVGLGWLFGSRFLLLNHIGRKSRLLRQTVLEVVRHNPETDTYIIAAGWGEQSDWLRNIQYTPNVMVMTGRRRFEATATRLYAEEARQEARRYAQDHPTAFRTLAGKLIEQPLSGTDEDYWIFAEKIPFIALHPR